MIDLHRSGFFKLLSFDWRELNGHIWNRSSKFSQGFSRLFLVVSGCFLILKVLFGTDGVPFGNWCPESSRCGRCIRTRWIDWVNLPCHQSVVFLHQCFVCGSGSLFSVMGSCSANVKPEGGQSLFPLRFLFPSLLCHQSICCSSHIANLIQLFDKAVRKICLTPLPDVPPCPTLLVARWSL